MEPSRKPQPLQEPLSALLSGYVKTPDALSLDGNVACDLSLTGAGSWRMLDAGVIAKEAFTC